MKQHSRPAGHFYSEKKVLYPSVTTILHQIPNPGLERWKEFTPSWRKISIEACKTGTAIHTQIEHIAIRKQVKVTYKDQIRAYKTWEKETGFRCLRTEVKVKSESAQYAGSLDLVGKIGNELFIIDIKTSKQIWPEYLLQLSAYKFGFLEANSLLDVNIGVLRIDKKEELAEWHPYEENEYNEGITEFLQLCVDWHQKHNTRTEFNKKFVLEND